MDYACLSCGAKYSIPDARVARAGADGLRVRCSRCRAIMAIPSLAAASSSSSSSSRGHDEHAPRGRERVGSRPVATPGAPPLSSAPLAVAALGGAGDDTAKPLTTGVWKNPFSEGVTPAAFAGHGLQTAPAVSREVTGVFLSMLDGAPASEASTTKQRPTSTQASARLWYCAIEGRARGPYTAAELLMLADKGKLRPTTLLWRPGAAGWRPMRAITDYDVTWLLDAVRQRRRREREAEAMALQKLGIAPVRLERRTVRASVGADDVGVGSDVDDGGPSALPSITGITDLDRAENQPFIWRAAVAPQHLRASKSTARRRPTMVAVVAVVAVVVAAAIVAVAVA